MVDEGLNVNFRHYRKLMKDLGLVLKELNQQAVCLWASETGRVLELALQVQRSLSQVEWDDLQPLEQETLVAAIRNQAYCYEALGRFGEALSAGLHGLELAQKGGLFHSIADFDLVLSSVFSRLGDYANSLEYNLKGLAVLQEHPDQNRERMFTNALYINYMTIGNFAKAYELCQASLEMPSPDDPLARALLLNNMAFALHQMGQYEPALDHALQSVAEFDRANFSAGKSNAHETLGSIYLALNQEEQAMKAYQAGLELARSGHYRGQEVNNLLGIARMQQRSGDLQAAVRTLLDILAIAQEIGLKQEAADANERLAEIYKQQGDYQSALHYFEAFHSISLKLSNEKAEDRLQRMHVQYEVERFRKKADQYEEQASADALTGLLNRRRFFELAEQSLHNALVEGRPLGMMMLDIDHFKQINDLHGHLFGDAVLVEVAGRLRRALRSGDWAGRYGGDELMVILHDASSETIKNIAERLRQAITGEAVRSETAQQEITICLGAAGYDGYQEISLIELVNQADRALLQAKQAGRDRVMLYEPEER